MSKGQQLDNRNEGFILLHRRVRHDWKWTNPLFRAAWTWLLVNAEWTEYDGLKRGQVRFSVHQAPKLWGMSHTQALRFLNRCVQEGSIIWKKGSPGRPKKLEHVPISVPILVPNPVPKSGVITIVKYDDYQDISRWLVPISVPNRELERVPLPKTSSNKKKRTASPSSSPSETTSPVKEPKKKATTKKVPDRRVAELINYFQQKHHEIRGKPYVPSYEVDGSALKRLLVTLTEEDIQNRMTEFLHDDLAWQKGPRAHTISIFAGSGTVNSYGQSEEPIPSNPAHRPYVPEADR